MKKILFLLLISIVVVDASEQGCSISFFKTEKSVCTSREKDKITIAPIVIEKKSKEDTIDRKEVAMKLRNILIGIRKYKKRNKEKTQRLLEELNAMKREFQKYKINKNRELKKIKQQLYVSKKKLRESRKNKLVKVRKKVASKAIKKKSKKQLCSNRKKLKNRGKKLLKVTKLVTSKAIQQKPKKEQMNKVQERPKRIHQVIHKVVHKMKAEPILVYDTPWIEIVVDKNTDIYDLALKYYGSKEKYTKIYQANKNIISSDLQIYNGMTLIIPMTEDFREQGIVLNQEM